MSSRSVGWSRASVLAVLSLVSSSCEQAIVELDKQGSEVREGEAGGGDTGHSAGEDRDDTAVDSADTATDSGDTAEPPAEVCLTADIEVGASTPPFVPLVDCSCGTSPMCHSLYDAQLLTLDDVSATLRLSKADGTPASTTYAWWLVDWGAVEPTCGSLDLPPALAEGMWTEGDAFLDVTVELWSAAEVEAEILTPRHIGIITGGGGHEGERIWFQPTPVRMESDCDDD